MQPAITARLYSNVQPAGGRVELHLDSGLFECLGGGGPVSLVRQLKQVNAGTGTRVSAAFRCRMFQEPSYSPPALVQHEHVPARHPAPTFDLEVVPGRLLNRSNHLLSKIANDLSSQFVEPPDSWNLLGQVIAVVALAVAPVFRLVISKLKSLRPASVPRR
jgi:hypothetical protein